MTTDEKPEEQLQALIESAKAARLSPADEDRAAALLQQSLSGGPKALPPALEAMILLPWSISVKAVSEAWPELKPTARTRLLAALAKMDSDSAKRLRLSLARGLHGQDGPAAQKLILGVCEAMFDAEAGASQRDRQTFANVLLGKAKPWLMSVPLAELKPAERLKLVEAALECSQHAPIFTQTWILRWIADAGAFEALPGERIEELAKTIQRWQPRWRKELHKIAPNLPPSLAALEPEAPRKDTLPARETPAEDGSPRDRPPQSQRQPRPPRQQEQRREPRQQPPGKPAHGPFDLGRTLREIENYVGRLQSEMQLLQAASRRREPGPARPAMRSQGSGSSVEVEELRRHNEQLEEQNRELRRRLEELASDHEDRAATLAEDDVREQFKKLLALKLKEDFADYNALSRESLTEVVRRHAQELLGHIFSVLEGEGVRLEE